MITGGPLTKDMITGKVVPAGGEPDAEDEEEEEDDENEDEIEDGSAGAQTRTRGERAAARARKEMLERLDAIPGAVEGLNRACPSLGELLESKFGELSVIRGIVAPDVYRRFFIQVRQFLRPLYTC